MTVERISLVVPVYNEEHNIARCMRGIAGALRGVEHEILVCYDFEGDSTLAAIAAMEDRPETVRLVKNDLGAGAGYAIRAGFAAASGDVIITTMADLSDPPELLAVMAQKIRREGVAVVSGSRYMRGGAQRGGPALKSFLSRVAGLSLRWIAGIGTHDATTNFRAYSRHLLDRVTVESTKGFDIALELTVKAQLLDLGVGEVPSTWIERDAGQSRFRVWKWMPHYLRWYARAMAAPVVVLLVYVLLAVLLVRREVSPLLAGPWGTAVYCALSLGAILIARGRRGRTRYLDALHAILWLHPWTEVAVERVGLAGLLAANSAVSAVLVVLTTTRKSRVARAVDR